jgi:hypothetical protein
VDLRPLLTAKAETVDRDLLLYFDGWHLQCARSATWKLHVARYNSPAWGPLPVGGRINLPLPKPELYALHLDPGEDYNLADDEPQIVSEILARIEALLPTFGVEVRNDWDITMKLKVESTPAGALPVLKNP